MGTAVVRLISCIENTALTSAQRADRMRWFDLYSLMRENIRCQV